MVLFYLRDYLVRQKKKDKEDGDLVYSVIFDEDGDVVRKVSVALVLEIP